MFNINTSNAVLLEGKKQETIRLLGKNMKVEDSEDEEPDFIQRLLKETDPEVEGNKESVVSGVLKF